MKYLLATSLIVGSLATLSPAAQARDGIGAGGAAALGVLGGLAVGGAIASSANNGYYPGRPVYRSAAAFAAAIDAHLDVMPVTADERILTLLPAHDLRGLVTGLGERHGRIDVLHFNPSAFRQVDALHLTTAQLFEDFAVGVASLLPAVQAAKPFMPAGARVLVTGSQAADTPWHEAPSLGIRCGDEPRPRGAQVGQLSARLSL